MDTKNNTNTGRLANKVVLLTGASGGIGQAIVKKFVQEGAKVIACDLVLQTIKQTFKDYTSEQVCPYEVNVTDYLAIKTAIDHAVNTFGGFDVMINNAGIVIPKPFLEHNPSEDTDFEKIIAVNQKGVYFGIHAAAKKMIELKTKGVILNTSSVYGQMAAELTFHYNASKAAVDMMIKCAALELSSFGIRVVGVAPGRVNTPMLEKAKELGLWDHMKKEQMRRTLTEPEEIAAIFAFLASEEAHCINGNTVAAEDGFLSFKYPLT